MALFSPLQGTHSLYIHVQKQETCFLLLNFYYVKQPKYHDFQASLSHALAGAGSLTGWSERFLGCRVRRNDAECDRAGRSSAFRRIGATPKRNAGSLVRRFSRVILPRSCNAALCRPVNYFSYGDTFGGRRFLLG